MDGEPLLARTSRMMTEALGTPPLIVGGASLPDLRPALGPLSGLETGFAACTEEYLLVVACDMPGLEPSLLRYLANDPSDAQVVLPKLSGQLHPLCARWHRSALPQIRRCLSEGHLSVTRLANALSTETVTAERIAALDLNPERALCNINRPADLARFRAAASS